jgi:hypothetical protein
MASFVKINNTKKVTFNNTVVTNYYVTKTSSCSNLKTKNTFNTDIIKGILHLIQFPIKHWKKQKLGTAKSFNLYLKYQKNVNNVYYIDIIETLYLIYTTIKSNKKIIISKNIGVLPSNYLRKQLKFYILSVMKDEIFSIILIQSVCRSFLIRLKFRKI